MTSYNIHPLRSKSSLGGFKMHHDKFISESSVRIVESPSCYVKCRDVDVNKLQELPSGGGIFSRVQGASIVYILSDATGTFVRKGKRRKIEKDLRKD